MNGRGRGILETMTKEGWVREGRLGNERKGDNWVRERRLRSRRDGEKAE